MMVKTFFFVYLLICSAYGAARVPNFVLLEENGQTKELYRYAKSNAIVLFWPGRTACKDTHRMHRFQQSLAELAAKGITVFSIQTDLESELKIAGAITLYDDVHFISQSLGVTHAHDAVLINPKGWTVDYRGPVEGIGPLFGLSTPSSTVGHGSCALNLNSSKGNLTFVDDIAPILIERCVRCHQPNGMAPWSMIDYPTVRGWSAMMKEVILLKRMPPWWVDPRHGKFKNHLELPPSDAKKILDWIQEGTVRGAGTDPLTLLKHDQADWALGEPDKIVDLPSVNLPAKGTIPWSYAVIEPFKEDTWIRGLQFLPGQRKHLHHSRIYLSKNDDPTLMLTEEKFFGGYSPGKNIELLPAGTGLLIRKGEKLLVEAHYSANGKAVVDRSKIGFYVHRSVPRKEFQFITLSSADFKIPPHVENFPLIGRAVQLPGDFLLHTIAPHMHARGRTFRVLAQKPNGESEVLLSVPRFSFNWQFMYSLEEPKLLSKGTKIFLQGHFDNSIHNRLNPDPAQWVLRGMQTSDEMLWGHLGGVYVR